MKTPHDPVANKPPSIQTLGDLLARAVADKLERDPSLLRIAIENIDRWLAQGVISAPNRFLRWRELCERAGSDATALQDILERLRSDTEEASRWRDFSPFAGVLSSAERRAIIRQCSYSHCNAEITYRVTSNRILASGYALRITHHSGVRNSSGVRIISAA